MVAYLSTAWVEALDRALAAVEPPADAEDLVVEYVVTEGDGGDEVAYHLALGPSGARAHAGRAARWDVRFRQGRPVAEAVGRGERSAQLAVLRGEVDVEGDAARLVPWRRALAGEAVAAALGALSGSTER